MLHLNDARTTLGSRLDRHEHIGAGQVGANGIAELLNDPWLADAADLSGDAWNGFGYDQVNLERVRLVLAGESLPNSLRRHSRYAARAPVLPHPDCPGRARMDRTKGLYRATHAHRNMRLSHQAAESGGSTVTRPAENSEIR